MHRIVHSSNAERKNIFIAVSDKMSLNEFIVEKDFWVSWILEQIFKDKYLASILCFKGGTSLSKAFGLINRFSEDIDLILSPTTFLVGQETLAQPTKHKQVQFNKDIGNRAETFIQTTLCSRIALVLGTICKVEPDDSDKQVLLITYPRVFDDAYIQPQIKLEIGPLALWNPNEIYPITSFVGNSLPDLKLSTPQIPIIKPERTFWEKLTILHHEHHRPTNSHLPERYSRHYYDVFQIGQSAVKDTALANTALLREVIEFKMRFYPRGWAQYEHALPGTIRLTPSPHYEVQLENDYKNMQNMIFNNPPPWKNIRDYLICLEDEINTSYSGFHNDLAKIIK